MTSTTRDLIKRKLAQSIHNTTSSAHTFVELYETFNDGHHPKYVELIEVTIQSHFVLIDLIKSFWTHAYGKIPENFDCYRR